MTGREDPEEPGACTPPLGRDGEQLLPLLMEEVLEWLDAGLTGQRLQEEIDRKVLERASVAQDAD